MKRNFILDVRIALCYQLSNFLLSISIGIEWDTPRKEYYTRKMEIDNAQDNTFAGDKKESILAQRVSKLVKWRYDIRFEESVSLNVARSHASRFLASQCAQPQNQKFKSE